VINPLTHWAILLEQDRGRSPTSIV
jgi:hypothetical protein